MAFADFSLPKNGEEFVEQMDQMQPIGGKSTSMAIGQVKNDSLNLKTKFDSSHMKLTKQGFSQVFNKNMS